MRRAELFTPRELFISSLLQCPRARSANEVFVRDGGCIRFGGKLGVWPCLCGLRWQARAPFQQLVKRTEPAGNIFVRAPALYSIVLLYYSSSSWSDLKRI